MELKDAMRGYNYDLPLLDELNNPEVSVSRRLLAGALIGEGLDTAYFATTEMLEAFIALETDARHKVRHGEGFLMAEEILTARNPLQMRLWHLLCEKAIGEGMVDLGWLKSLAFRRGNMARVLREENLPLEYVPARDLVGGVTAADLMATVIQRT